MNYQEIINRQSIYPLDECLMALKQGFVQQYSDEKYYTENLFQCIANLKFGRNKDAQDIVEYMLDECVRRELIDINVCNGADFIEDMIDYVKSQKILYNIKTTFDEFFNEED
jgi:hypothetical protein